MVTVEMVKEWRRRNGVTQAQLAGKLGVTVVCMSNYERGMTQTMVPASMEKLEHLVRGADSMGADADTYRFIAADLRALADIIDSQDYPRELKVAKLRSWITFAYENFAQLKLVLEKELK